MKVGIAFGLLLAACLAHPQTPEVLDLLRSPDWKPALAKLVAEQTRLSPEVVNALGHSEAEVRRRAAETLAERDLRSAVPRLAAVAREDKAPEVRREATLSLAHLLRNRRFGHHGEPWSEPEELQPLVEVGAEAVPVMLEILARDTKQTADHARNLARHGTLFGALRVLRALKDPRAFEPLIAFVGRSGDFVLHEAMLALAAYDDPRVVPTLIDHLSRNIPSYGSTPGKWVLETMGARAVPGLLEALEHHRSPSVRADVAEVLGEIKDPRALAGLIRAAGHSDSGLRAAAVGALGHLGSGEVRALVGQALSDPSALVRFAALDAVRNLRLVELAPQVALMVKDPDLSVRATALAVLPVVDPVAAAPLLIAALDDPKLKAGALASLRTLKPTEAEAAVLARLKDSNEHVVYQAAALLGELRSAAAIPELLRLIQLPEDEWYVASSAATAVALIGPPAAEPLFRLFESGPEHVRDRAAEGLGGSRDPRAVDLFIQELARPKPTYSVIEALGMLGDPRAIGPLLTYLPISGDRDYKVAEALGELKAVEAVVPLIRVLEEDSHRFVSTFALALGKIGDPRGRDVLIQWIDKTKPGTNGRWMAIDGLGYLKGPAIVERLIQLLAAPWPDSQGAAIALGRTGDASALPPLAAALQTARDELRPHIEAAVAAIRARG